MITLLTVIIILLILIIVLLLTSIIIVLKKINNVASDMIKTMQVMREAVAPVVKNAGIAIGNVDQLVCDIRNKISAAGRLIEIIGKITEGKTIAKSAFKAVSSSKPIAVLVLSGIKAGLKAFLASNDKAKGKKEELNK